jgi:hypothetical protein
MRDITRQPNSTKASVTKERTIAVKPPRVRFWEVLLRSLGAVAW